MQASRSPEGLRVLRPAGPGASAGPCLDLENAPVFVTGRLRREPSPGHGVAGPRDAHTTEEDAEW